MNAPIVYAAATKAELLARVSTDMLRFAEESTCEQCRVQVVMSKQAIGSLRAAAANTERRLIIVCGKCAQNYKPDLAIGLFSPDIHEAMKKEMSATN